MANKKCEQQLYGRVWFLLAFFFFGFSFTKSSLRLMQSICRNFLLCVYVSDVSCLSLLSQAKVLSPLQFFSSLLSLILSAQVKRFIGLLYARFYQSFIFFLFLHFLCITRHSHRHSQKSEVVWLQLKQTYNSHHYHDDRVMARLSCFKKVNNPHPAADTLQNQAGQSPS